MPWAPGPPSTVAHGPLIAPLKPDPHTRMGAEAPVLGMKKGTLFAHHHGADVSAGV